MHSSGSPQIERMTNTKFSLGDPFPLVHRFDEGQGGSPRMANG